MTSVGLFEPSWHPELVPPMVTIAHAAVDDVFVFVTKENHDHAKSTIDPDVADECTWVVNDEDETQRSFFQRVSRLSAGLDVFWLLTSYGHRETTQALLSFRPQCPSVVYLHSATRFLPPAHPSVATKVSDVVTALGHQLPSSARNRIWKHFTGCLAPTIIEGYDCYLSIYPPVAEYIRRNVTPNATVAWFLPEYHRPEGGVEHTSLQITIPGRIQRSRRDYESVLDMLQAVEPAGHEFVVCLLGSPVGQYGQNIMKRCEKLVESGYEVIYYPNTDWVSEAEFDEQLSTTDLLLSPDTVDEGDGFGRKGSVRGQTKGSAVVGEAVRIGRPLFLPVDFTAPPEFEGLITTYSCQSDAIRLLERWIASPEKRDRLCEQASSVARQYDLHRQADRFEQVCKKAIRNSSYSET